MISIDRIHVHIRGVWGAPAPQKPTTHYKNKIKWRRFLYNEPGYFFLFFSQARSGYFFLLFSETDYFFFYSLQSLVIFSFKTRDRNFFWKITQATPRISNGLPLTDSCPYILLITDTGPVVVEKVTSEKDLGVTFDQKLKFTDHINNKVNKANRNVGLIFRTFTYIMNKEMFLNLYKSIVRPHLEYASTVWSPMFKKDKILIENVQRRATCLVKSIKHLPYEDRLKTLGLPSLEYRRERSDMIHHHHHHHIRFRARFPLPRVGLFDKSSSKTSSPLRAILRVSRVHI